MGDVINMFGPRERTGANEFLDLHKDKMADMLIVGFDKDGDVVFGANGMEVRDVIYLMERLKHHLLEEYGDG